MLSKTFEWLRVAAPKPDNAAVEGRQKAVADILTSLDQEEEKTLLAECVTAAVADPAKQFTTDSRLVTTVVEAVRKYQPAFPADLSENALHVRVTCALTVGEVLLRPHKKGQKSDRTLTAALILSGLGVRPEEGGKHLRAMVVELREAAGRYEQKKALAVRRKDPFDAVKFDAIAVPGDVPAFWTALKPVLKGAVQAIHEQRRIDHEEVEVLWWLFKGRQLKSRWEIVILESV